MSLKIPQDKHVVLAETVSHKGYLHALAESGGTLRFKDFPMFGVRVLPLSPTHNTIQLVAVGKGGTVSTGFFKRERKVVQKKKEAVKTEVLGFKEEEVEEI